MCMTKILDLYLFLNHITHCGLHLKYLPEFTVLMLVPRIGSYFGRLWNLWEMGPNGGRKSLRIELWVLNRFLSRCGFLVWCSLCYVLLPWTELLCSALLSRKEWSPLRPWGNLFLPQLLLVRYCGPGNVNVTNILPFNKLHKCSLLIKIIFTNMLHACSVLYSLKNGLKTSYKVRLKSKV